MLNGVNGRRDWLRSQTRDRSRNIPATLRFSSGQPTKELEHPCILTANKRKKQKQLERPCVLGSQENSQSVRSSEQPTVGTFFSTQSPATTPRWPTTLRQPSSQEPQSRRQVSKLRLCTLYDICHKKRLRAVEPAPEAANHALIRSRGIGRPPGHQGSQQLRPHVLQRHSHTSASRTSSSTIYTNSSGSHTSNCGSSSISHTSSSSQTSDTTPATLAAAATKLATAAAPAPAALAMVVAAVIAATAKQQ